MRYIFTITMVSLVALGVGCTPEQVAQLSDDQMPVCGDGVIEGAEACDDGNLNDGDGCSSQCTLPQECQEYPEPVSGECSGQAPERNACAVSIGDPVEAPKMIGSSHPNWTLVDLQPASCGYEQFYGLDTFRGTPTMVVLLWAGCSFCQGQAEKLQEMHTELIEDGVEIDFVIVDQAVNFTPPIEKLVERCDFPIFQDVQTVDAWGLHSGVKDDFFFYDADGQLEILIEAWGEVAMDLSSEEGYRNVKNAALVVSGREPIPAPAEEPAESESADDMD